MPADRFYVNSPLEKGASIELEGAEHHHLSRVMRIAIGETVEIVNGKGVYAVAKVKDVQKEKTLLVLQTITTALLPASKIIVAIPLMRPNKLEWTLEKAVELGVDRIYLYTADHSEKIQLSKNQLERLTNLTISALKQSGRLFLPSIELLSSLQKICDTEGMLLFGDIRPNSSNLLQIKMDPITLLITGPERGFSQNELKRLDQKGIGVRFSPYTLRAETAPLAALSILSAMRSSM